jgi:DivIVA domain-containing protein
MPLTPDDIERKQFLAALRGYDREQVDAFLAEVAEDYRTLLHKIGLFGTQRPSAHRAEGGQLQGLGEHIEKVLRTAAASAREIRATAEEEVARLREEAHRALEEGRQAMANAAHQSDIVAAQAAEIPRMRQETQRALEEAAQMRAAAEREAATLRAEAERETDELRQAAEREAATLVTEAERKAKELRQAAEWRATTLRTEAQREADALRTATQREVDALKEAADWACQESARVLAAAEEERHRALEAPAKGGQDSAVASVTTPGPTARDAGPGPDEGDEAERTSAGGWFPFADD